MTTTNLPYLNPERLNTIFEEVYATPGLDNSKLGFDDEKMISFSKMLHTMKEFNYLHRPDDTWPLFSLLDDIFNFEPNSDGTTLWLALILAIQELYGFSDKKLISVMKQVTVRH